MDLMQAFFRFVTIMLLLLVGFHTVETDGPCDYEEHFISEAEFENVHSHFEAPADHEHVKSHVHFGEHFGHCSVVISSAFSLPEYLPRDLNLKFLTPHLFLAGYIEENFRPPRLV